MNIRKCTQEDVPAVGIFYDKVVDYLDHHINYPKWSYKKYPSEKSARLMTEEGSQYLCEEEGVIVGAFVLNDDPQANYAKVSWKRDIPEGDYMILHTLAIDPDTYGKGYATQVLDFCTAKAKKDGYLALRVDIVPENLPARRLYEKNGFTYAGDEDLERGLKKIPVFSLFEKNWEA